MREGLKTVAAGANPMALKRGINAAVDAAVGEIQKMSKEIKGEMIAQVGAISANNDKNIGGIIAEAMGKVGKDGVITVEEAKSIETSLEVVEGMQFDRGYLSPYFVTDPERMESIMEDAYILLHEKEDQLHEGSSSPPGTGGKGRKASRDCGRGCRGRGPGDIGGQQAARNPAGCAIKAPGFGDRRKAMLEDIAILTGGKVISEDLGIKLENVRLEDLGQVKKVTIDKDNTTLVEGAAKPEDIAGRVKQIRTQVEETTSDYDREKLQERLAKLVGGVAVIQVGAATETELKEKKARVEDAMHATKAAAEEGIVPGGGVAFIRALGVLEDLKLGMKTSRPASRSSSEHWKSRCARSHRTPATRAPSSSARSGNRSKPTSASTRKRSNSRIWWSRESSILQW